MFQQLLKHSSFSIHMKAFSIALLVFASLYTLGQNTISRIDSLRIKYEMVESDSAKVFTLVEISREYSLSDLKNAVLYSEKAVTIAENNGDEDLRSYAYFNSANAHFIFGLNNIAVIYYSKFIDIKNKNGDQKNMAYGLSNMGLVRLKLKEYNSAKSDFQECFKILQNIYNYTEDHTITERIPYVLNNLSLCFKGLDQYDSAFYYIGLAKEYLTQEMSDNSIKSVIYNNLGELYLNIESFDSSSYYISEAIKIRKLRNDMYGLSSSYMLYGKYYDMIGDKETALESYYSALFFSSQVDDADKSSEVALAIHNYYLELGNSDSALKYHMIYKENSDIFNDEETYKELAEYEYIHKLKEKEQEYRNKEKRSRTILLIYVISSILVLLIITILYFLNRSRLQRIKLEQQNALLKVEYTSLEKKKLKSDLEVKNKELVSNAMYLYKKNEILKSLAHKLEGNKKFTPENQNTIDEVIEILNINSNDSTWQEFEIRFQEVHTNFYEKLQSKYPNLSPNERKICAFLKLNMTTKEIASLTGQNMRSIEVARTRLRKKLNLTNSGLSLMDYLNTI